MLPVHHKTFGSPELRTPLRWCNPLRVQLQCGFPLGALWELGFSDQPRNVPALAVCNELFSVSDPEVLCLLPASTRLWHAHLFVS